MILIIDYGMGNLGSIANMIKRLGYKTSISNDIDKIKTAKKIILPGVGAFDEAMRNLRRLNITELIKTKVIEEKTPILGICLGMQLMANKSEEGREEGLGLIEAEVVKFHFSDNNKLKIPHMGWNTINIQKEHPLFSGFYDEPRFYFVHSYHVVCNNNNNVLTTTEYGYPFVSSYAKNNILGVQFHPEKSHKFGMKLIKNFIENC